MVFGSGFIGLERGRDGLDRDPSGGDELTAGSACRGAERRSPDVLPDDDPGDTARLHRRGERSANSRSRPNPGTSASSVTASVSVAKARHRWPPTTPRRSASPAAPSTRSSLMSRGRSSSIPRRSSPPGSPRTDAAGAREAPWWQTLLVVIGTSRSSCGAPESGDARASPPGSTRRAGRTAPRAVMRRSRAQ